MFGAVADWTFCRRFERLASYKSPAELFRESCRVHRLDRTSRRLLKRLAAAWEMPRRVAVRRTGAFQPVPLAGRMGVEDGSSRPNSAKTLRVNTGQRAPSKGTANFGGGAVGQTRRQGVGETGRQRFCPQMARMGQMIGVLGRWHGLPSLVCDHRRHLRTNWLDERDAESHAQRGNLEH